MFLSPKAEFALGIRHDWARYFQEAAVPKNIACEGVRVPCMGPRPKCARVHVAQQKAAKKDQSDIGIADKNRVPASLGIEGLHSRPEVPGIRTAKGDDDGAHRNAVFFPARVERDVEEDGVTRHHNLHVASNDIARFIKKHHLDLDWACIRIANIDRVDRATWPLATPNMPVLRCGSGVG